LIEEARQGEGYVQSVGACTPAPTYDCAERNADCCRSSRVPAAPHSHHSLLYNDDHINKHKLMTTGYS